MSGLPATFACPWCGMSYPAKPVLIGKPVRCKGCRNAFVLQPEGIALKHEDPAPAPAAAPPPPPAAAPPPPPPKPPAPTPPAPVPAPAPAPRTPASAPAPARPASAPAPARPASAPAAPKPAAAAEPAAEEIIEFGAPAVAVPATPPPVQPEQRTPRPGSERTAKSAARKGRTEHLEAARAKMAADLAAVAHQAANSEAAKREERKSERVVKSGAASGQPAGDPKRRSRKAVLTGEGERAHRERLMWVIGSLAVVGVILLVMVLLSLRSGIRGALDAYTAPVADTRFMAYGSAIRARAWLAATPSQPGGTAIALDLGDAAFGVQRTIDLAPLKEALAQLKGLRPLGGTPWWVRPADEAKARAALAAPAVPGESTARALARAQVKAVEQKAWLAKLTLSEEDAGVLLDLLAGTPSKEGVDFAKRILDDGEVPERLLLRPFTGRKGDLRLDLGPPPYKAFTGPYQGLMLRVEGVGWPVGWRVLRLEALSDRKP